jgi:hypothetical protein
MSVNPESIEIDGRIIHVGSSAIVTKAILDSEYRNLMKPGEIMFLRLIYVRSNNSFNMGFYSDEYKSGWHDLDGNVENGHGWFFEDSEVKKYFKFKTEILIVSDFEHKKENLKGMKGRILAVVDRSNHLLIELEKNVGGSSGDGLGKRGHCLIVDKKIVKQL